MLLEIRRAVEFTASRASELRLRILSNFPEPMYDDDTGFAENGSFVDSKEYSNEENLLIQELMQKFLVLQATLMKEGFLEIDRNSAYGTDVVLTSKSTVLLRTVSDELESDRRKARLALNVNTAILALEDGGTHAHNGGMRETKLHGSGNRNVVALLYKACRRYTKNGLDAAIQDIAAGIAAGARYHNRQQEVDNLDPTNKPGGDLDKYVCLFKQLATHLPDIFIPASMVQMFRGNMRQNVLHLLLEQPHVSNYKAASDYLHMWNNPDQYPEKPLGYLLFTTAVKHAFAALKEDFVRKVCSHNPMLENSLRRAIDMEIATTETAARKECYLYTIMPQPNELSRMWQHKYPSLTASFHNSRKRKQPEKELGRKRIFRGMGVTA